MQITKVMDLKGRAKIFWQPASNVSFFYYMVSFPVQFGKYFSFLLLLTYNFFVWSTINQHQLASKFFLFWTTAWFVAKITSFDLRDILQAALNKTPESPRIIWRCCGYQGVCTCVCVLCVCFKSNIGPAPSVLCGECFLAILISTSAWGEGEKQCNSSLFSNVRNIIINCNCLEREIDHQVVKCSWNMSWLLQVASWSIERLFVPRPSPQFSFVPFGMSVWAALVPDVPEEREKPRCRVWPFLVSIYIFSHMRMYIL